MTESIVAEFAKSDTWIHGAFALEQGFIFTSMVLAATTVAIIERRFNVAAAWLAVASLLSMTGLMHGYRVTPATPRSRCVPRGGGRAGNAAMSAVMLAATWLTEPDDDATGH